MSTQHTPGPLKVGSFVGGIRMRVPVTIGAVLVGEMIRRPRTGWHTGPANTYRFDPNEAGGAMGLHSVSGVSTIRAAIAKATGSAA